ncbi:MAG: 2-oxoacid:acceptor oxidoreductase family protein [Halobacteriota archaeon]
MRIAGEGGQGTVVAGTIIGEAAAINGRNVFKTEEYGSRARGGVASSDLIISDTRIHEAKVPEGAADVLVALTDASLADHRSVLCEGGRLIVDADRVTEPPAAAERVPFTGIATDVASERSTNMAVLGYLNAALDIADDSVVEESIERNLDASIEDNLAVYRRAADETTDLDADQ